MSRAGSWTSRLLTDQAIIRRMVLKRCIYGVDKNPLTVELAKVSLWLHSFTVGAPLSFLDHHLRCGDSLIGLRVAEAREYLRQWGGLFAGNAIAAAETATDFMQSLERDIRRRCGPRCRSRPPCSAQSRRPPRTCAGLLDFVCGLRWQTAGMKVRQREAFEAPLVETLGVDPQNTFKLLARGPDGVPSDSPGAVNTSRPAFGVMWDESKSIADRERVLHWEAAFPGVWSGWQDDRPKGGFNAVIGNPPWDQIEQPEVEWFALRDDEIARAPTGSSTQNVDPYKKRCRGRTHS